MDAPRAIHIRQMFLKHHILEDIFGEDLAAVYQPPETVVNTKSLLCVEANCYLENATNKSKKRGQLQLSNCEITEHRTGIDILQTHIVHLTCNIKIKK